MILSLSPLAAETIRVATFDVGLVRDGPGLLLNDLRRGPEPDIAAAVAAIQETRPDILLLNGFDHDFRSVALAAFRDLLRAGPKGIDYPSLFDSPVNAGVPSGRDLDGDGETMGWKDAVSWGKFPGNGGMALLSRFPLAEARTFRTFPWRDLPGADAPEDLPLSSKSHWDVVAVLPGARLHLLASNPTPPLFDGPDKRNARRNNDEIGFWLWYLEGATPRDDQGEPATLETPFVLLGDLNADPEKGAGKGDALRALLTRLPDPLPRKDTAVWPKTSLRLDYVLPSPDLRVTGAGVVAAEPLVHRLVWVDLLLPLDQAERGR